MKFRQLWSARETVGRRDYFVWGTLLVALKWNLDRFWLATGPSGDPLFAVDYFRSVFSPDEGLAPEEILQVGWPWLLVSLPFLWAGLALTVGRLRSARFPIWIAVLLVVPMLKWLLVLVALVAPHREPLPPGSAPPEGAPSPSWLVRIAPRSRFGSAVAGVAASTALFCGGVLFGVHANEQYGAALFLGVPFVAGFASTMIHGARERRELWESIVVSIIAALAMAGALLLFAIEGVICILMAAPLAGSLAVAGGVLGHTLQPSRCGGRHLRASSAILLAMPLMLGAERLADPAAPLLEVRSSIDIAAPPGLVWRHVVEFSELPPPDEWIFRIGVAYPIRAEIDGRGPGAVRHCIFSTGAFVEPIEVWDEPRLLSFGVTACPPPLEEWTPYRAVHPPHLDGFLVSERGQFRLIPLPEGGTRLEGTTWYRHHMWPVAYWQAWSDEIIHRIHLRVLRHIRDLAEADPEGR